MNKTQEIQKHIEEVKSSEMDLETKLRLINHLRRKLIEQFSPVAFDLEELNEEHLRQSLLASSLKASKSDKKQEEASVLIRKLYIISCWIEQLKPHTIIKNVYVFSWREHSKHISIFSDFLNQINQKNYFEKFLFLDIGAGGGALILTDYSK